MKKEIKKEIKKEMKKETENKKYRSSRPLLAAAATLLCGALLLGCTGCGEKELTLQEVIRQTAEYEQKTVPDPGYGTLEGDWILLALARSNEEMPEDYQEIYLANLEKAVKEAEGVLSQRKYTEYSRVCLTLQALGEDVTDFGGYDLMQPLRDTETVNSQGINGTVYALLAFHAEGAADSQDQQIQDAYLSEILGQEKASGGFSINEQATEGDADTTAMVLQCLEPYEDREDAAQAVKRGIQYLAGLLSEDGTYLSYGEESSESLSQVILALSANGVDCNKDPRFIKKGKGLYDRLLEYRKKDGGFSHTLKGDSDRMATDQAFCALVAYERFLEGKNSFYEMSDHR